MRERNFRRGLLVLTLGAIAIMSACVARAQYEATQSNGRMGSSAANSSSSNSSGTNSAGKPARAGLSGTASQWNAGSGNFSHSDTSTWSIRNGTTSNPEMWSPGRQNFGSSAQEGGVWKVQPAVASGVETTPATESGAAPSGIPENGLQAPALPSLASKSMPSSGQSINRVAMHGAHATGPTSATYVHGASRSATQGGAKHRSPFASSAHRSKRPPRERAFGGSASHRSAAGQAGAGSGTVSGQHGVGSNPDGLEHLGSGGLDNGKQKKTGSGLEHEPGSGTMVGHSE
jgi:hypothetical protein